MDYLERFLGAATSGKLYVSPLSVFTEVFIGSPFQEPLPRPSPNPTRPASNTLQRIGPPPLALMNQPRLPKHPHMLMSMPALAHPPTDVWANTTKSPISAYIRYLQNSIVDQGFRQPQP
ncbi:vq domain-containing protein [Abeliophyllum distichum]|uniref:Vq domain-containing protein n=1 Tax=Abeliophyllum distichum TaxID=126358 RepID=A0ABD1PC62_9LAMI